MYRGAAQEQEKQLGGYCGNPGEMKEPWDEGDSSGDGENRLDLDLGWIFPLTFYCENFSNTEKSIPIELPSGSTMNTLLDLLYHVSVHLSILFLSPSLEHLWFNFYKEKPSVSCCDDVVIGTMEIVTGIATLEWGAVKIWGLTDPYTDFQPFLLFSAIFLSLPDGSNWRFSNLSFLWFQGLIWLASLCQLSFQVFSFSPLHL